MCPDSERKFGYSYIGLLPHGSARVNYTQKKSKKEGVGGQGGWFIYIFLFVFSFLTQAKKKLKTSTLKTHLAIIFLARLCNY